MKNTILILISALAILCGCSSNKRTLHIFSWADYVDPEIIIEFEKKYNCNVCIDTFDSNESAYSKLKAGASGYDICIPSSYMVEQMSREGMIQELDHSKLTTVNENFDHSFDSQIADPNMKYSVPYIATYTGVMCLKDKVNTNNLSWSVFTNKNLFHKTSLLEDIREVIGAGLMYNGYSTNSENQNEISKATETVLKWKKNITKFDAEAYKLEVVNKSIYLGHAYSSDAFQIIIGDDEIGRRDNITFVLPKEGFTITFDEMVIMKNSENVDLAYAFINYMYENDNALRNMKYNFSPMAVREAIENLPDELKKIIILDKKTLSRGQVLRQFKNIETIEYYNKAWDRIKSSR